MASIWSEDVPLPWSQVRRRLNRDEATTNVLVAGLVEACGGELRDVRPLEVASDSRCFAGRWGAAPVVVKVNATQRECFWMSEVSSRSDRAVAHVYASGDELVEPGLHWLVVEELPFRPSMQPGPAWFDAALDAALAYQVVAATIDTELVYREDVGFYEMFVASQADVGPGKVRELVRTLDEDWAWASTAIEEATLFGDLHFGNVAAPSPEEPLRARLFDPIPRRQPWVFEPAYFETIARGSGLVGGMAARRRAAGLSTPDDDALQRAETLFLAWLSVMWWGIAPALRRDPAWVADAAARIEKACRLDR